MKEDLSAYLIPNPAGLFCPTPLTDESSIMEPRYKQFYSKAVNDNTTGNELNELLELLTLTTKAYISNFKVDSRIPYNMSSAFEKDMSSLSARLSGDVVAAYSGALAAGLTQDEASSAAYEEIIAGMNTLAGKLERYEKEFSTRLLLDYAKRQGFSRCLFISEQGQKTCERCSSHHGVVFSVQDVPIPPLHPNCRCELLLMKPQTELLYRLDRRGFIEVFYRARSGPEGGVYFLDGAAFPASITPDNLTRATLPDGRVIIDISRPLGWKNYDVYEHIAGATSEYVAQLSRDGNDMLEAYLQTQSARGERKWDNIGSLMDWLTLGIVSGIWQGFVYRHEEMAAEPNLYNITNAITMGLLDNVKGSVVPEKPWSLEHWLDIVSVVLTIFAAYKTAKSVKKLLTGSADDVARIPRVLGGDSDDIARNAGLTQAQIRDIIDTPSGLRPDPKTYLSKEYIDNHLSMFKGGVTKFYATAPTGSIGPKSGTFVFPSPYADEIIKKTNGNVRLLEQLLGLPSGALGEAPVRVDIHYPTGLRIPSGNERGANDFWLPGGYTSGGLPEAVIDQVQPGSYSIYRITGGK